MREVLPIVLHHHENWQGDGYPHRLSGEQIPLGARIIRVADTYEVLISLRPYRQAYTPDEAVQFLVKGMGSEFDPRIVKTFVRQLERVQSSDDLLEHWAALQQEARVQRVLTSIPLLELSYSTVAPGRWAAPGPPRTWRCRSARSARDGAGQPTTTRTLIRSI